VIWFLFIVICLGFGSWILEVPSLAADKQYDGIWFLGFNLHKDVFGDVNGKVVRRAVTIAIDRNKIAQKIIGDDVVPVDVIPPGMEGYDSALTAYPHDYREAKKLMKSAGYTLYDKRLKTITLLHTDGVKTKEIVDEIKRDLINLGFDITTTQIKFSDTAQWNKELASGKYHMFVMGYKAGSLGQIFIADKSTQLFHIFTCFKNSTDEADIAYFNKYEDAAKAGFSPCAICKPQPELGPKTLPLIQPLFYSDGTANFTFYRNKRIDILLEELSGIDENLKTSRQDKFEEIGRALWEDCPIVPLFYITRL